MSIAEDFDRGFLAVPAANYSTLLHRSVDFNPFLALQRPLSRPARPERSFALIQQLWDRAEPQGYMQHTCRPATCPTRRVPHKILIHMATYDSEVSNLGTEIMVRSLGIAQVIAGPPELLRRSPRSRRRSTARRSSR